MRRAVLAWLLMIGSAEATPESIKHPSTGTSLLNRAQVQISDIIETKRHPFWGKIQRRRGYDGWDHEFEDAWPGVGKIRVRMSFEDPDDAAAQTNYRRIRARWADLWPRILRRVQAMKKDYGYQEAPVRPDRDWFSINLNKPPITDETEWSVMLQAEEAGWLLDFEGWEDAGGQGVF